MSLRCIVTLVFLMSAPLAQAQSLEGESFEEGLDRFSDSARRFMQELAGELGPLLLQLEMLMDEISSYQAPEILDNGDIIIRRKPEMPAPPSDPLDGEEDAPIEL